MRQDRTLCTRTLGTLLGALFVVVGMPSGGASAKSPAPAAAEKAETKNVALVKVEIRQESGKVIKNNGDLVGWNEDASLKIKSDDITHALEVKVVRDGDKSKKASVTLAYARGGEAIIAPYTFDVKLKKREVIQIEGGLAIALTVVPKKVAVKKEEAPPSDSHKVEKIDGDDPLAGI